MTAQEKCCRYDVILGSIFTVKCESKSCIIGVLALVMIVCETLTSHSKTGSCVCVYADRSAVQFIVVTCSGGNSRISDKAGG